MLFDRAEHLFVYAFARTVFTCLRVLPWETGRKACRNLGRLFFRLDRSRRKANAIENLCRAFPAAGRSEARRLLRASYAHLLSSVLDALHFVRLVGRRPLESLLETEGFEKLPDPSCGLGVMFVTGHIGHWEVMGAAAAALGYPVWTMTRPSRNPFLRRYVARLRSQTHQHTLHRHGSLRRMLQLLRTGRHVALLIDQDARRHGVFVDFFGRPASTTPAPAMIALRAGAPVVFVHARRVRGGNRFRVTVEDVVWPDPEAGKREEIHRITQRITRDLEEVVRRAPEEWLWLHRRWKTDPDKHRKMNLPRTERGGEE